MLSVVGHTIKLLCFLYFISIYVSQSASTNIQSPCPRHYVVVFDIDNTLCDRFRSQKLKFAKEQYPECPIVHWKHEGKDYPHFFLPYLQILFDYLLEKGVRIVFFSSAIKERNTVVIPELLKSFWGGKKYEKLKSKGQFSIFSREHMRQGNHSADEGNFVKDLKVVVRDGESLLDCVLVEDDHTYTAHDQRPCMSVMCFMSSLFWDEREFEFDMNNIYYMIGLFKTYFEHMEFKKLPFRKGLEHILSKEMGKKDYEVHFEEHPFARKVIEMGLSEVRKEVPNARLYGSFKEGS